MAIWNFKKKNSHAELTRVAIRLLNIYTFKQQIFAFSQLSNFSNLRFALKLNVLFVRDLEFTITF